MVNKSDFVDRMQNINKLLDSSKRMGGENRNNIVWYCREQKRQCVEKYSDKSYVKIKQ